MTENIERIGAFTSSEIYKLLTKGKDKKSFGAPALAYIQERKTERRMGRSLDVQFYSHATSWGLFLEKRVETLIDDFGYMLESKMTRVHPKYSFWSGSRDMFKEGIKVGDIKCFEPSNFAKIVDCFAQKSVDHFKSMFPKEYWQLVSNGIISNVEIAESIVYMPYLSELEEIREAAANYDDWDQWKYRFISDGENSTLPYLPDDGYYKNLNRFEFEIPQSDMLLLESVVLKAEELTNEPSILIAHHDETLGGMIVEPENILSKLKKIKK